MLAHSDFQTFVEKLKKLPGPPVDLVNEVNDTPSPPVDFEFLTELKLGENVPPFDPDFVVGCSCPEEGCTDRDECECIEDLSPRRFAYGKHGRVVVKNLVAIFECNDKCACGPSCGNRVVQKGRQIPLQIFMTEKKGWGIRCPIAIKKGTFIDRYLGEVIDPVEARRRGEEGHETGLSYLFDLDKFNLEDPEGGDDDELSVAGNRAHNRPSNQAPYCVDGRACGTITRFINHSCAPNLDTFVVASDRRDGLVYDLALFANRDIEPYEELAFSYVDETPSPVPSSQNANEKSWPCYCGAATCTKKLWY